MKLEPTEAQRKAMAEATEAWNWYSCGPERRLDMVDDMIAAANIPEGPPVGTIARRPDGEWIAWRTEDGWGYRFIGDEEPNEWPPGSSIADSWPVIFTPGEAVGSGPTTDGGETYDPTLEKTREEKIQDYMEWSETQIDTDALDPTAQQGPPKGLYGKYRVERMDGKPIRACFVLEYLDDLHANKALLEYAFSVERVNPELAKDLRTEWGKWPGRSQQEPGESLARGLDDLAAGRVSRRDDYLEPQQEPATTHPVSPESTNCVPKPRAPRVIDRLGVDEQGSRWRDANGFEWRWGAGNWFYYREQEWAVAFPDVAGPFREILEPRVLPSLDCEEARDGTVWEFTDGSDGTRRIQHQDGEWICRTKGHSHTCAGTMDWATGSASLGFGPYTEVIGDPS
ncbi:hypothetical protein [Mycobacteroides abscessus]|uniref:hypothetical protein n=1 Tax=Mycobacteroides abscessus TaxID=36809 RepID=UPI0018965C07|nr:hypothetical protein [Mycobacteroides abscessus]MDO3096790.1 hypothetical protein [Mycobacteroides abscessus subsp. abscessus]